MRNFWIKGKDIKLQLQTKTIDDLVCFLYILCEVISENLKQLVSQLEPDDDFANHVQTGINILSA